MTNETKYETLKLEEWKLLLKALDIDISKEKCRYCKEQLVLGKIGLFTDGLKKDEQYILTCDSPLCITNYMTDKDEENELEKEKAICFYKHLKNHEEVKNAPVSSGIPVCKICNKDAEQIFEEEND